MNSCNSDSIKTVLENLGYKLSDNGRDWRTKPLYRDSGNDGVLCIRKDDGRWIDFARNYSGSFEDLIEISLNKPKGFAKTWLKKLNLNLSSQIQEQNTETENMELDYIKFYDKSLLSKLKTDYSYWASRKIKKETLDLFDGGLCYSGKMVGRYVFPIYDENKNILGFSGRSIKDEYLPKWKHIGRKSEWKYPLFLTKQYILESKTCIIVESIGDGLKLWQSGIRNFVITFGLTGLDELCYTLVSLDPEKIVIAFNNDAINDKKSKAGNLAAQTAKKKFLDYFDKNQVLIKLPPKNDFGEMSEKEIQEWNNN